MAVVAKALGDPVRLQLVDVLRKHAGKSACVSWCRCSICRSRPSPTISRCCAKPARRLRARGAVGLLLRHPRRSDGVLRMAPVNDS